MILAKKFVGVDPGMNGGLAVIEKDLVDNKPSLLSAVWWKPVPNLGFHCTAIGEMPCNIGRDWRTKGVTVQFGLRDLGELYPFFEWAHGIAVEALFVGPARQRIIGTAETAGALLAAASRASPEIVIDRPMASLWRSQFLRLPPVTASQADKYAKKVVNSMFPSATKVSGHAIDAICIALWEAGYRGTKKGAR